MREHWKKDFRFKRMHSAIIVLAVVALILLVFQESVRYKGSPRVIEPLEKAAFQSADVEQDAECLILWEADENGKNGKNMMESVLDEMGIRYETQEGKNAKLDKLDAYQNVVISMTHLKLLNEEILSLMKWVENGGNLLLAYPPETNGTFLFMQELFGIADVGNQMVVVEGFRFPEPFMIGGQEKNYKVTDAYESSMSVQLKKECKVYMESDEDEPVPLVWEYAYGKGKSVVCNLGFLEKAYRGFYSSTYSLLGDYCAWPVINGSVFYIDDFPSPVPAGDSEYIREDYGMDIKTFYTQMWWNDTSRLAEKYGVRYTGLVIEQYSDKVEAPFKRNGDLQRYQYFGNMLLDQGGEIGLHGYNHMPLCLSNFDYERKYPSYKKWESYEDMKAGVSELYEFCQQLFPKEKFRVYVPPSNILSNEGREMLVNDFQNICAIASVYLPGDLAYEQEFEVAEDGMIETPRVISGYILDDYVQIAALSELNLHYVNSHFQHPDDVLDEDRGAAMGWEKLYGNMSDYMEWLYTSAPNIRNLTGTEIAGAVQRYDTVKVGRREKAGTIELTLDGFADEAWLMLRFNEGKPGEVKGGTMEHITGDLYLLKASAQQVIIEKK